MEGGATKEHLWLRRLIGYWECQSQVSLEPHQSPVTLHGTETVRPLGDLWVLMEGEGEMPDGTHGSWLMALGYDPRRGRFVGAWMGSMMPHLWLYEGTLDEGGNVLPLDTEGPAMGNERLARYRDVIEFPADDRRLLRSLVQGEDGQWHQFQRSEFRRAR
ncbi:MAG TPA: DUF1579 domain-containing protein [Dehalococcoidia bacterium]|nr:DUF1579 domain-containing protein [Dehalococcoidia bacterium]